MAAVARDDDEDDDVKGELVKGLQHPAWRARSGRVGFPLELLDTAPCDALPGRPLRACIAREGVTVMFRLLLVSVRRRDLASQVAKVCWQRG